MTRKVIDIGPLSRVEGDLEIRVEIEEGEVVADVTQGVMFRGFERLLVGRSPMDAIVLTSRICGICSAAHAMAASRALADAYKTDAPPNGHLVGNMVLATEVVMSHILHFYTLFSLDLTNKRYSNHPCYKELTRRFLPFEGTSYIKAIRAKGNIPLN